MDQKQTIEEGLKSALKQRDSLRVSVLRMLMSSIKYKEVEKGRPLSEDEFHGVVKTLIKQRSESIESFKKGQRLDLVEKEEKKSSRSSKSSSPPRCLRPKWRLQ